MSAPESMTPLQKILFQMSQEHQEEEHRGAKKRFEQSEAYKTLREHLQKEKFGPNDDENIEQKEGEEPPSVLLKQVITKQDYKKISQKTPNESKDKPNKNTKAEYLKILPYSILSSRFAIRPGDPLLCTAIKMGRPDIVKLLISYGADPEEKIYIVQDGITWEQNENSIDKGAFKFLKDENGKRFFAPERIRYYKGILEFKVTEDDWKSERTIEEHKKIKKISLEEIVQKPEGGRPSWDFEKFHQLSDTLMESLCGDQNLTFEPFYYVEIIEKTPTTQFFDDFTQGKKNGLKAEFYETMVLAALNQFFIFYEIIQKNYNYSQHCMTETMEKNQRELDRKIRKRSDEVSVFLEKNGITQEIQHEYVLLREKLIGKEQLKKQQVQNRTPEQKMLDEQEEDFIKSYQALNLEQKKGISFIMTQMCAKIAILKCMPKDPEIKLKKFQTSLGNSLTDEITRNINRFDLEQLKCVRKGFILISILTFLIGVFAIHLAPIIAAGIVGGAFSAYAVQMGVALLGYSLFAVLPSVLMYAPEYFDISRQKNVFKQGELLLNMRENLKNNGAANPPSASPSRNSPQ